MAAQPTPTKDGTSPSKSNNLVGLALSPQVWLQLKSQIAGSASGMANTLAGHPFDTLKVRLQTEGMHGRFKGPIHCLMKTVREEGFRGLYKGVTPPLVGMGIINSTMFGSMNFYKERMAVFKGKNSSQLTIPEIMACGVLAGWTVSFVVCPIEQIKARLQIQYARVSGDAPTYTGPIDCARKLVRNNGLLGLYKGFPATLLTRTSVYAYFGGYYATERWFKSRRSNSADKNLTVLEKFLAGGAAGTCYWFSCFPFDVVKNRMMSQPDVKDRMYKSVRGCIRQIYQKDGIRGFWRGFVPCLMRTLPANGATFVAFNFVMEFLE